MVVLVSYEHSRDVRRQHRGADARDNMPERLSTGDEGDIKPPIQGFGSLDSCVATADDDHLPIHCHSALFGGMFHAIMQVVTGEEGKSHLVTKQHLKWRNNYYYCAMKKCNAYTSMHCLFTFRRARQSLNHNKKYQNRWIRTIRTSLGCAIAMLVKYCTSISRPGLECWTRPHSTTAESVNVTPTILKCL